MVEAESAADAEIVRQSFQARVDAMADDTTYPEEAGMWKNNATVTVNGNYVVLEVLPGRLHRTRRISGKIHDFLWRFPFLCAMMV